MSDYKCKCGNTSDFFIEHKLSQCGMYCSWCGKWIKWLNKDEERLFKHKHNDAKIRAEIIDELKDRLIEADGLGRKGLESVLAILEQMKERKKNASD